MPEEKQRKKRIRVEKLDEWIETLKSIWPQAPNRFLARKFTCSDGVMNPSFLYISVFF